MKRKKKASGIVKKIAENAGLSLIEVLLAIVILGLVAAPILQIFVTSAQINIRSRKLMAATDIANVTMEYVTAMKFDAGTTNIKTVFTTTGSRERIPGVAYKQADGTLANNCTASAYGGIACNTVVSYSEMMDLFFDTPTFGYANCTTDCVVWSSEDANSKCRYMTVVLTDVVYNDYTFDIIIHFEADSAVVTAPEGDTINDNFYTYNVTVEVFDTPTVKGTDDDGNEITYISHFTDSLVRIEGAVANK